MAAYEPPLILRAEIEFSRVEQTTMLAPVLEVLNLMLDCGGHRIQVREEGLSQYLISDPLRPR